MTGRYSASGGWELLVPPEDKKEAERMVSDMKAYCAAEAQKQERMAYKLKVKISHCVWWFQYIFVWPLFSRKMGKAWRTVHRCFDFLHWAILLSWVGFLVYLPISAISFGDAMSIGPLLFFLFFAYAFLGLFGTFVIWIINCVLDPIHGALTRCVFRSGTWDHSCPFD